MGYIAHHAIIVTCFRVEDAKAIRRKACRIIGDHLVSNLVDSKMNGYQSFFVAPDGSKEGWSESDEANKTRAEFLAWFDAEKDEDIYGDYVLLRYGGDASDRAEILKHN